MPWCAECAKYYAPTGLNADGHCRTCGAFVGLSEHSVLPEESHRERLTRSRQAHARRESDRPAAFEGGSAEARSDNSARPSGNAPPASLDGAGVDGGATSGRPTGEAPGDEGPLAPWHFWVTIGLLALYLAYRFGEGVLWIFREIFG